MTHSLEVPRRRLRRLSAGSLAMMIAGMQVVPAFATINNTVTATGTGPGNVPITSSAPPVAVGVEVAAPKLTVVKTATLVDGPGGVAGKGDPGETINYTYVVKNTGNVTLTAVGVADAHDGTGTPPAPTSPTLSTDAAPVGDSTDGNGADNKWDTLKPGDAATFTASYVITAADINANGGGTTPNGSLHNTATASGTYTNPQGAPTTTTVTATDTKSVPLNVAPSLNIAKVADKTSNVKVGDVITYTYTVSNLGNTSITNVTLADTHNGVAGALTPAFTSWTTQNGSTNTGNTITVLTAGAVAVYKATYTVTQNDIDNRQ